MLDSGPTPDLPPDLAVAQRHLDELGQDARGRLLPGVYQELRALAASYFADERPGHTLQPTALVHEAFAKLAGGSTIWSDREHFLALAATVMRHVLADHARSKARHKRGGDWRRVTLSAVQSSAAAHPESINVDLVALDQALTQLAALDDRQARIVELRYLAGMTVEEVAKVLDLSQRAVELEWRGARAWLRRELEKADCS